MTGGGNDANPKHRISQGGTNCNTWGAKGTSAGNTSSPYYTQDYAYTLGEKTGLPPSQEFPAAMYWTRLTFSLLIVVFLFWVFWIRKGIDWSTLLVPHFNFDSSIC